PTPAAPEATATTAPVQGITATPTPIKPTPTVPAVVEAPHNVYLPLIIGAPAVSIAADEPPIQPALDVLLPVAAQSSITYQFDQAGTFYAYALDNPLGYVTITVLPGNNRVPIAGDAQVRIGQNEIASIRLDELAYDPDRDPLMFTAGVAPTHGYILLREPYMYYVPNENFTGTDTITYWANDLHGSGQSRAGQIEVIVEPRYDLPIADSRTYLLESLAPFTVDLTRIAYDPNGQPIKFGIRAKPTTGAVLLSDNQLTFHPTPAFTSTDQLSYSVFQQGIEVAVGQIVFERRILATDRNNPPLVDTQTVTMHPSSTVTVDLQTLVRDPDGAAAALQFALAEPPHIGTASLIGSQLQFTAPISESVVQVRYQVTDDNNATSAGEVFFQIVQDARQPQQIINLNRAVRLEIEPSNHVLTTLDEEKVFTVKAYNALNQVVPFSDTNILWGAHRRDSSNHVRYRIDPQDPARVLVRTTAITGYVQMRAAWNGLVSSSGIAIAVEFQPGVTLIPAAAVRDEAEFTLPPALRALPSEQWDAWIAQNGADVLPHYRTIVDEQVIGVGLAPGMLLATDASTLIFGRLLQATPTAQGTEIIYAMTPITEVVRLMEFNGVFGAVDVGLDQMLDDDLLFDTFTPITNHPLQPDTSNAVSRTAPTLDGDAKGLAHFAQPRTPHQESVFRIHALQQAAATARAAPAPSRVAAPDRAPSALYPARRAPGLMQSTSCPSGNAGMVRLQTDYNRVSDSSAKWFATVSRGPFDDGIYTTDDREMSVLVELFNREDKSRHFEISMELPSGWNNHDRWRLGRIQSGTSTMTVTAATERKIRIEGRLGPNEDALQTVKIVFRDPAFNHGVASTEALPISVQMRDRNDLSPQEGDGLSRKETTCVQVVSAVASPTPVRTPTPTSATASDPSIHIRTNLLGGSTVLQPNTIHRFDLEVRNNSNTEQTLTNLAITLRNMYRLEALGFRREGGGDTYVYVPDQPIKIAPRSSHNMVIRIEVRDVGEGQISAVADIDGRSFSREVTYRIGNATAGSPTNTPTPTSPPTGVYLELDQNNPKAGDINAQLAFTVRVKNAGNETTFRELILDMPSDGAIIDVWGEGDLQLINGTHQWHWKATGGYPLPGGTAHAPGVAEFRFGGRISREGDHTIRVRLIRADGLSEEVTFKVNGRPGSHPCTLSGGLNATSDLPLGGSTVAFDLSGSVRCEKSLDMLNRSGQVGNDDRNANYSIKLNGRVWFEIGGSVEVAFRINGLDVQLDHTVMLYAEAGLRYTFDLNARLSVKYEPTFFELVVPMLRLLPTPIGVDLSIKVGLAIKVDVSARLFIQFEMKGRVEHVFDREGARITKPEAAAGSGIYNDRLIPALIEDFAPEITYELAGEIIFEASLRSKLFVIGGIPDTRRFASFLAQMRLERLADKIPDLTVAVGLTLDLPRLIANFATDTKLLPTYGPGSAPIGDTVLTALTGHGRYGVGAKATLGFDTKKGLLANQWINFGFRLLTGKDPEKLLEAEGYVGFPDAIIDVVPPDSQNNQRTPVCGNGNTNNPPNGIACQQVERQCEAPNEQRRVTDYYRVVDYQQQVEAGSLQRYYTFDSLLTLTGRRTTELGRTLADWQLTKLSEQINGFAPSVQKIAYAACDVAAIEEEHYHPPRMVSQLQPPAAGQSYWSWNSGNVQGWEPGRYELATFIHPLFLPLRLYTLTDFSSGTWKKNADTFQFSVGCTADPPQTPAVCPDDSRCEKIETVGKCGDEDPLQQDVGDPHVTTWDGVYYTSLHRGEFVRAVDTFYDTMEYQIRQEVIPGSPWAAVNTAVAVRVGEHVIQIERLTNRLLIDGEVVQLPVGSYPIGAATLVIQPRIYTITFPAPDGSTTKLIITLAGGAAPHLNIAMSTGKHGLYRGTLGIPDNNPANDWTTRAGDLTSDLNTFFESWRITTLEQSLFTYAPGNGPWTYNQGAGGLPSPEYLRGNNPQGRNYLQEAADFYQTYCGATMSLASNADFLTRSVAIDLIAGITPDELADAGRCFTADLMPATGGQSLRSELHLSGRVVHADDTALGLAGVSVEIRAVNQQNRIVCETISGSNGMYTCALHEDPQTYSNVASLSLQYRVGNSATNLPQLVSITPPTPGGRVSHHQDLPMRPDHVLWLSGRVLGPDGLGIANTTLTVTGPIYAAMRTRNDGTYNGYVTLPPDVSYGLLTYTVNSRTHTASEEVPFSFATNGIHAIPYDVHTAAHLVGGGNGGNGGNGGIGGRTASSVARQLTEQTARRLTLQGTVRHPHPTGRGVVGAQVSVSGMGMDSVQCPTNDVGQYSCDTIIHTAQAFPFEITVSGVGSAQQRLTLTSADIPRPGENRAVTVDITAQAVTTLDLNGRLTDPSGNPVANAMIEARLPGVSVAGMSAADGSYRLLLDVPDDLVTGNQATGNLAYRVQYGMGGEQIFSTSYPFSAAARSLTTIGRALTLTGNTLRLTGQLRNAFAADGNQANLNDAVITISSPQLGPICETKSDGHGFYRCSTFLATTAPISLTYQVTRLGNLRETTSVDPAPALAGGQVTVVRDLTISPTTLVLQGQVQELDQRPLAGVTVGVGTGRVGQQTTTDANGMYRLILALDNATTAGTLSFNLRFEQDGQIFTGNDTYPFQIAAQQRTVLERTLQLNRNALGVNRERESRVQFQGMLRNHFSAQPLANATLDILAHGDQAYLGTLCTTTTDADGGYSCPEQTVTARSPLTLQFRASRQGASLAPPITTTQTLLPGTTHVNQVYRDLTIQPTTLQIEGLVTEQTGRPLLGAEVQLLTPEPLTIQTDEFGRFRTFVALPSNLDRALIRYVVRYQGLSEARSVTLADLNPAQLNTSDLPTTIMPFIGRSIILTGRVSNTVHPQAIAGIPLELASPELGALCRTTTGGDGRYSCAVEVASPAAFTVYYTLAGRGSDAQGAYRLDVQPPNNPSAAALEYTRDFAAPFTTLRIVGTVRDSDNRPVAGAMIDASGLIQRGNISLQDGSYQILLVLPDDLEEGMLTLLAQRNGISDVAAKRVWLTPRTLNEVRHDFTMSIPSGGGETGGGGETTPLPPARTIYVLGYVTSDQLGDTLLAVPNAAIRVSATGGSSPITPCVRQTDSSGYYSCILRTYDDRPLNISIQVDRHGYGSASLALNEVPAPNMSTALRHDFTVAPTLIEVEGTVRDGSDNPLPNVGITFSQALAGNTTSDTAGRYRAWGFLENDVRASAIGFDLRTGNRNISLVRPITIRPNQVNQLTENLFLEGRALQFKGQVINGWVAGTTLPNVRVEARTEAGSLLCADTTTATGTYACTANVTNADPFAITYVVTGSLGTFSMPGAVAYVPPVGLSAEYPQTLTIAPTTLVVQGTARTPDGLPLAGTQVTLQSNATQPSQSITTAANGTFQHALVFAAGVPTAQLDLSIRYGVGTLTLDRRSVPLKANTLITDTIPITFSVRKVRIAGTVQNPQSAGVGVAGVRVRLRNDRDGTWCDVTSDAFGTYTCPVLTLTSPEPLAFTATVTAGWGSSSSSQRLTEDALPAVGTLGNVLVPLEIAPTTVIVQGFVRDGAGVPIPAAYVTASGALNGTVQTDSRGAYRFAASLPTDQLNAAVALRARYGDIQSTTALQIPLLPNQPTTSTHTFDLALTQMITISGVARNAFHPATRLSNAQIALRLADQELWCTTTTTANGAYHCPALRRSASITSQEPLTFTATLTDSMGVVSTAAYTVTADMLPPAGFGGDVAVDLRGEQTTLRLAGRVLDPDGVPLSGATVRVRGDATLDTTTVAGVWETFVIVDPQTTSAFVTIEVSYDQGTFNTTTERTIALTPRGYTEHVEELVVTGRRIVVRGQVEPDLPLGSTYVSFYAPDGDRWCTTTSDPETGNTYRCPGALLISDAIQASDTLTFTATVSGTWGTTTRIYTVRGSDLPPVGQRGSVVLTLQARPTVLYLTGTLKTPEGQIIPQATVTISGTAAATTTTAADGSYRAFLIMPDTTNAGTFTVTASYTNHQTIQSFTQSFPPAILTQQQLNLTLQVPRNLALYGSITHAASADLPLGGSQVFLSAPAIGTWCAVTAAASGSYTCPPLVLPASAISNGTFPLTALISGTWGFTTDTYHLPMQAVGILGTPVMSTSLNLVGAPTALRVQGRVDDPDGVPLAGAQLRLTGSLTATLTTAPDGTYAQFFLLPRATTATLQFTLRHGLPLTLPTITRNIVLLPNDLTVQADQLNFGLRQLTLTGNIQNRHIATQFYPDATLSLTAPTLGTWCTTTTDASGSYTCPPVVLNGHNRVHPFSFTAAYTGTWGSTVQHYSIPVSLLPVVGQAGTVQHTLYADPTMIRLMGTLRDPAAQPLPNSLLQISGDALTGTVTLMTSLAGQYDVYLPLREGRTAATLTVACGASLGTLQVCDTLTLTELEPGTLTSVTRSFYTGTPYTPTPTNSPTYTPTPSNTPTNTPIGTATNTPTPSNTSTNTPTPSNTATPSPTPSTREIVLQGTVLNENSSLPIAGANIQISTGGTAWCNVTADANGAYTCPARTIGGGDYSFIATVQGAWGETTRSYTIIASSLPAMGASGFASANLYGDPTTLRLTGTLVNPDNQPLVGASVTATGDIVGSTTTNTAGVYDVYILTDTTGNHNVTLTFTVGSFSVQREVQITLSAGALRTHREDIEFTQRAFTMSGRVVNAFIPGMTLGGATVVLSSPELGEWCSTTSTSTGTYQCPTVNLQEAYRSDTPFRFTATIDSIWGELVQSYTIPVQDLPAVGTSATLTRNLAVGPTTLRVTGVVRGGSGIPLGNASVQAYGAALSAPASTTATSDGRYTIDMVIKPNTTSGTLSFAVNGNNATETLLFNGLQTTLLNERSKDLWTLGRTIATLAGNGAKGFTGDGGSAQVAQLSEPFDVTRGPNGSLYVMPMIASARSHRTESSPH
ncbi:MAG: hypothetical protein HC911_12375, partial [Chloroflexaceae bacterium]|nr:hypothetical protein [Chloroflexaceae bacterium]